MFPSLSCRQNKKQSRSQDSDDSNEWVTGEYLTSRGRDGRRAQHDAGKLVEEGHHAPKFYIARRSRAVPEQMSGHHFKGGEGHAIRPGGRVGDDLTRSHGVAAGHVRKHPASAGVNVANLLYGAGPVDMVGAHVSTGSPGKRHRGRSSHVPPVSSRGWSHSLPDGAHPLRRTSMHGNDFVVMDQVRQM